MRINVRRLLVGALAGACVAIQLGGGLSAQAGWTVVMSGLDHPRGMAIGPEGGLYVAEAGRGEPGRARSCCRTKRRDALG